MRPSLSRFDVVADGLWERRLSTLVETVSKKAIPPHVKDIVFEVMVNDDEGEDVEVRLSSFVLECGKLTTRCAGSLPEGPGEIDGEGRVALFEIQSYRSCWRPQLAREVVENSSETATIPSKIGRASCRERVS